GRGGAATPRASLSHDAALRRRHGLRQRQDLRPRSLAAGTERVSRNLVVLEFRGVPGEARPGALPRREGQGGARAHVERLGPCDRAHAGRDPRELPERGLLGDGAEGARAVHGRRREDRERLAWTRGATTTR